MKSLAKQIESKMQLAPRDVYFPSDFFDLSDVLRVNKALSRMAQNGQAWRLARGIYATFVSNRFGRAMPSTESLVASYAKKAGEVITEIGAVAINVLGFSTQNVLREIYLTSGKPMIWDREARTVEFRKGTKIELFFGNTLEGVLVRAWHSMGEDESADALPLLKMDAALRVDWDAIINVAGILPDWMVRLARKGKLHKWNRGDGYDVL